MLVTRLELGRKDTRFDDGEYFRAGMRPFSTDVCLDAASRMAGTCTSRAESPQWQAAIV